MTRPIFIIAAAAVMFVCSSCSAGGGNNRRETPEHVFNMANKALSQGDDAAAIDLFYRLEQEYPGFNKYGADILIRLGTLLYKTERYDEAEKTLAVFVSKYRQDNRVKKACEMLLYIYIQETHDGVKAQKMRDFYAKSFGDSATLMEIDRTRSVLFSESSKTPEFLRLDAADIGIPGAPEASRAYDTELFPVKNLISQSVKSPDGKYMVESRETDGTAYLYISRVDGKMKRVKLTGSSRGYAPQWSWDNRYVVFTSKKMSSGERAIKVYDVRNNTTMEVFRGRPVEPLLCVSPDSSKIIFCYNGRLWIMNRDGNSVCLLSKAVKVRKLSMTAWSKDGGLVIFSTDGDGDRFYTCRLGRRDTADNK
jgi:tetratricopeptide (TPR) repeat protein